MFQYAATFGIAKKSNATVILPAGCVLLGSFNLTAVIVSDIAYDSLKTRYGRRVRHPKV